MACGMSQRKPAHIQCSDWCLKNKAHILFTVHKESDIVLHFDFICRYWHVFQRLVVLGWTDDARDLLYTHSEVHAVEEQLSRYDEVRVAPALPWPSVLCRVG